MDIHSLLYGKASKEQYTQQREKFYLDEGQQAHDLLLKQRPKPISDVSLQPIPEGYCQVAASLSFDPGQLLNKEIESFLVEQQIPRYDYQAVQRFMTELAIANKANFFWRPLRKKDQEIFGAWGWRKGCKHGYYQPSDAVCSPYDKLVPVHILNDVSIIQDRFGNRVAFFVSDYKANSPDPFILVTAPSATARMHVFGAWDEPGFGVI